MKTNVLMIGMLTFLITSTAFSQSKIYPSNDGPDSELTNEGQTIFEGEENQSIFKSAAAALGTVITTADNENNVLAGIPDFDMDVYLFNTNSRAPIEFNIFVDESIINEAQLSILAWDIDWSSGERDAVYFNGNFIGYLTGANGEWSTSLFSIDPSIVIAGPGGKNLLQIEIDVDYVGRWAVTVDWGQLVINGGGTQTNACEYRTVSIPKTIYQACEWVTITEEIDAAPSLYVRAETNLVDPNGNIVAGTSRYLTATPGDEPFIENLMIPCSAIEGDYNVVTILYDGATNLQLDILYTPFTISSCPNDIIVGNSPGECGANVVYNTPPGNLVEGLPSGSLFPVGSTIVRFEGPECSFTVTVTDVEIPTALCQNAIVYLEKDGTVTIEAEDVDAGSSDNCSFDLSVAHYLFNCDDLGSLESVDEGVTMTITDASGNTDECTSTITILQRPTTLTYTGDLTAQYSDEINLSANLIDDISGDGIAGMTVTFEFGNQSTTGVTDASGLATATLKLDQSTCDIDVWYLKAKYAGGCPYLGDGDEELFTYQPENAEMEYTGVAISATESVNSDNYDVTLRGIIMDANDGYSGDISKAQARFLVNDSPVSGWQNVKLLDASNPSIGMIEFLWEDAISNNPSTFEVKIEMMGCYYIGKSMAYPLTVYNAAGDFITGGGHMIMTEAADGLYEPSPDSRLNFGFNVKFNKNGKNLQGKMNIIYRILDEYGNIVEKYQIKSNATTSLGTNRLEDGALIAEFVSKANLTLLDEYDVGQEIAGNLTLHVRLTDRGEPGDMDQIAFSLYNGDPSDPNALWFSSNWLSTQTVEQIIAGGNLVVHSGVAISSDGVEEVSRKEATKKSASGLIWENSMTVYPNPFVDNLYFEFSKEQSCNAKLAIFDMNGRLIDVLFDQPIEGEKYYRIKYTQKEEISGMLFYRMIFDDEVISGKVIIGK